MARGLSVPALILTALLAHGAPCSYGEITFSDEAPDARSNVAAGALTQYLDSSSEILTDPELIGSDPSATWIGAECEDCQIGPCDDLGCGPYGGPLFVEAWLSQGFTWNTKSPSNRFNTPVTFNDRSNEYQMNQLYVSLGRAVTKGTWQWDLGGQVDLLYGTDYFFTTASGLETHIDGSPRWNAEDGPRAGGATLYGLAMPQLYAEVFAPWGNGLTVQMGHFYTIMGYETVPAPYNFFYSRSYSKQYGEPFTHTGLLADYPLSPWLSLQAGFTRGWDTWEDPNDKNAFLGGLRWISPDEMTSLAFAIHAGSEDPGGQNDRTAYSLVFTQAVSPCITYVFQHDFGTESGAAIQRDFGLDSAKWYSIAQYLLVGLTPTSSMGLRVEWFRDQDNARVLGIPIESQVDGGNYVEITLGANWKPVPYMTFRPELRWDWSDVAAQQLGLEGMFNDFLDSDQILLAADLIVRW